MTLRVKHFSEQTKRYNIMKAEYYRTVIKSVLYNQNISKKLRFKLLLKCSRLAKKTYIIAKNRCINSNRAKSVIRFFRLSRIEFRLLARKGKLVGVRRASW
jgi:small subunit ribosomal protein S14